MAEIKVTLTDDDLRAAVVAWAQDHHGMEVDPASISVTARTEFIGNGPNEMEVHKPEISFTGPLK